MARKVRISDLVLRDAHQSLHATRMTTADMLPICEKLDKIGYESLEAWGGATFDSCIRFLNEDPWERLRQLKAKLPNTPIMMLLRGQNLLGYRHYADDVVDKFVEAAAKNGVGVFRIFDACNDPRNLKRAADAAKKNRQTCSDGYFLCHNTVPHQCSICRSCKGLCRFWGRLHLY
jgi:oxaloacetate decarboxylase alpha subunit